MNTQRREEILALIADQNGTHAMDDYRAALIDAMDWIDQIEAKAAERIIADGAKGPTPDYTGEGSAWVPPKVKPHTFAKMVNEIRDLAFDFGTSEQFRDRVADLLGKYIRVEHGSNGVPRQIEKTTVVLPELTDEEKEDCQSALSMGIACDMAHDFGFRKGRASIPSDRVLGDVARVLQQFVDWCEKYPSSRTYDYSEITSIARQMDMIHEAAKVALRANQEGVAT